jgi:hypothetical protein
MDEILQNLLNSELLSEDARAEISSKWTTKVNEFKTNLREEVSLEVRSELAEQYAVERDALVESVDTFVSTRLIEEIAELKADIENFRDLEAEFAEKIVEEKHSMAKKLSEELDELIDKMDAFFELRLTEELTELREDLDIVKQNHFGRKIFEAFVTEFNKSYVDEDSTQSKLAATLSKLADAQTAIAKLEESQSSMIRESKMEKILSSLTGKKREQMAFVLANVETSRLDEAYKHFIGRVLKEDSSEQKSVTSEPAQLITESTKVANSQPEVVTESAQADTKLSYLRQLAGITT